MVHNHLMYLRRKDHQESKISTEHLIADAGYSHWSHINAYLTITAALQEAYSAITVNNLMKIST